MEEVVAIEEPSSANLVSSPTTTTSTMQQPGSDNVVNGKNIKKIVSSSPTKKLKKGGGGGKTPGFRKAPQAPRRFKSPYILFSISKMAEYKQGTVNVQVTSISRRIAEEWKGLSAEDRKKWDEVALQDKLRYNAEKRLYTGPWQVPSKRSRKDPSAPKRPASAFLFFCQTQRKKLKRENPELKNTEISKLLGELWKKSPSHIRQPHIEREQRERESYKCRIAAWREQRQREEDHAKKQRIAIAEQYVQSGGMNLPTTTTTATTVATPSSTSIVSTTSQGGVVVPVVPTDLLSTWGSHPPASLPSMLAPIQPAAYYSIPTPTMYPSLDSRSGGEHHHLHHQPALLAPFPPAPAPAPQESPMVQNNNNTTSNSPPTTAEHQTQNHHATTTSYHHYAPAVHAAPEYQHHHHQSNSTIHEFSNSLQEKSFPTMSIGDCDPAAVAAETSHHDHHWFPQLLYGDTSFDIPLLETPQDV